MIFTLAINAIAQGLMVVHTSGFAPQEQRHARDAASSPRRALDPGIPNAVWMWAAIGGCTVVLLRRTTFGRRVYGIGNSERAVFLSRGNVDRVVVACFAIAGACAAFAGVLLAGYSTKAYQAMGRSVISCRRSRRSCSGTSILGGREPISDRRRRGPDDALAVDTFHRAGARGRAAGHLRRGHHPHAVRLRARAEGGELIPGSPYTVLDERFLGVTLANVHSRCFARGPAGRRVRLTSQPALPGFGRTSPRRMMRYDETDGSVSVFRQPATTPMGTPSTARAVWSLRAQCRCVTRTEHDGSRTVLVERYQGKRLNSPNDVVVKSDGSICSPIRPTASIPTTKATPLLRRFGASFVYRYDPATGDCAAVATDFVKPNGLAFSPDEKFLYIADTGATHVKERSRISGASRWAWMAARSRVQVFATCDPGLFDGFRLDVRATSGRAPGMASIATARTALSSARSTVPEVSPMSASAPQAQPSVHRRTTSLLRDFVQTRVHCGRRPPTSALTIATRRPCERPFSTPCMGHLAAE